MKDLRDQSINRYRIILDPVTWAKMGVDIKNIDPRYNGAFIIPVDLKVIASTGGGWDHVSVSLDRRCPTWEEMELVAKLFFNADEIAIQYHLPASDHINIHPFALHWWRPHSKLKKIPMPPKSMV